jgi:preprotein translocase subunit YajC
MAALSVYVSVSSWDTNKNRAFLFMFFTIIAVFMFFFKRNFRKKIEKKKK